MLIQFIGVGEAFDEQQNNTSIFIQTGNLSILLDCGFTAASSFWALNPKPLLLDALFISHLHGDHCFGVPHLLLRFYEHRRTKELHIIGSIGLKNHILQLMDMSYPNLRNKLTFSLIFHELNPDQTFNLKNTNLITLQTNHSIPCLGLGIENKGKKFYYSGDGVPSQTAIEFCNYAEFIVLETYKINENIPGHNSILNAFNIAKKTKCQQLALVHLNRNERQNLPKILELFQTTALKTKIVLPSAGSIFFV